MFVPSRSREPLASGPFPTSCPSRAAAISLPPASLSRVQWRWLASPSERHACLDGRGRSLRGRTRRPGWKGISLAERPYAAFQWFSPRAFKPPVEPGQVWFQTSLPAGLAFFTPDRRADLARSGFVPESASLSTFETASLDSRCIAGTKLDAIQRHLAPDDVQPGMTARVKRVVELIAIREFGGEDLRVLIDGRDGCAPRGPANSLNLPCFSFGSKRICS